MGRLDMMIELESEPQWRDDRPKKEEKKRSTTRGSPSRIDDDHNESQSSDEHVTYIQKDYDLYLAAKNDSLHDFLTVLDRASAAEPASYADILRRLSPAGNTYLHVAAKHGNKDIVTYIAAMVASLVSSKNSDGDTPLHLAAKAGQEAVVKALLVHSPAENLLRAKNERRNTALHEALINGHESVAQYLVKEDPTVSCYKNDEGKSVLYLAARYGYADCVRLILQLSPNPEHIVEQLKEKSPIHAAIKGKNRDVLEAMLNMNANLVQLRDAEGRNPLHYAASLGYLEEVRYLLDKCSPSATQRDNSGSFPIHLASIYGSVDIISLLLQDCPCPEELLDRKGLNILHLAARNGRYNIVRYILSNPALEKLINMKDRNGNTPLHLATKEWHPRIVSALTWDKRVDVKIVNDDGMTALDVAEYYMKYNSQFRQRLTWAALKAAGTPRSLRQTTAGGHNSKKSSNMENYKDRVNTLLLVSTLVATVTFAAGFTVPGGYNTSDTDLGIAAMLREKGFHIFVFGDTIAMFSSIVVAVVLIWAQLGDLTLALNALTLAVPLLGIALTMMAMAFTAGVFLAVSKLRWLSTAVLVMGITFFMILVVLLLPLCTPITSTNRILRYLSFYSFYLLILATRS
ncbi:protein ACCELERATED CELL DEATH 6 [Sesamum alatum]|uniref:Protein ACCELERATED CELL DEATH 6 n=1 Tax=Sesamum alatum TaxID=300844 RepID=A0AAE2CG23_9LAMI|nr:protein ACCELERATED CELL DEATH 6 [Sesamum alatum]